MCGIALLLRESLTMDWSQVVLAQAHEAAGLGEVAMRMWWKKAAMAGDAEAQFRVGMGLYEGAGA